MQQIRQTSTLWIDQEDSKNWNRAWWIKSWLKFHFLSYMYNVSHAMVVFSPGKTFWIDTIVYVCSNVYRDVTSFCVFFWNAKCDFRGWLLRFQVLIQNWLTFNSKTRFCEIWFQHTSTQYIQSIPHNFSWSTCWVEMH